MHAKRVAKNFELINYSLVNPQYAQTVATANATAICRCHDCPRLAALSTLRVYTPTHGQPSSCLCHQHIVCGMCETPDTHVIIQKSEEATAILCLNASYAHGCHMGLKVLVSAIVCLFVCLSICLFYYSRGVYHNEGLEKAETRSTGWTLLDTSVLVYLVIVL